MRKAAVVLSQQVEVDEKQLTLQSLEGGCQDRQAVAFCPKMNVVCGGDNDNGSTIGSMFIDCL